DVKQECIISVFLRRNPKTREAIEFIFPWIKALHPVSKRKGWISNCVIEGLQLSSVIQKKWIGQGGLSLLNSGCRIVMQDHVHLRQGSRRYILLLTKQ